MLGEGGEGGLFNVIGTLSGACSLSIVFLDAKSAGYSFHCEFATRSLVHCLLCVLDADSFVRVHAADSPPRCPNPHSTARFLSP